MRTSALIALVAACVATWTDDSVLKAESASRQGVPAKTFVLDLDKAPADRWLDLGKDPSFANYKEDFTNYIGTYIPKAALPLVAGIVGTLKSTFDKDYADEMTGLAKALDMSVGDIVIANLIYQVEGLGNSCEASNNTGPCPPKQNGPGLCTGVVASGQDDDGSPLVWHGRNLDWNLPAELLKYAIRVDYQRNNRTIFSGVQIAGEVGVLHGIRPGAFSVQLNARDHGGSLVDNLAHLPGSMTPTHLIRRTLENKVDFFNGLDALSTQPIANPAYFIVAGVQSSEGAIVTRERKDAVDIWHLFEAPEKDTKGINFQPDWFRLQTNYDHWDAAPAYDNRRDPGVANMKMFCSAAPNSTCLKKVLTTWPTQNHHTDVTSVMCPKTGHLDVTVWASPAAALIA